ncbi:MAG: hypothetical protein M0R76_12540 [Proteobacteria bacterium]|nr:hypothetical protein [Pseudomonadota bacterium]
MTEFRFVCPHCHQMLDAPAELLGQEIQCPSCQETIALPETPQTETPQTAPSQRDTRACPFCGESILATAIKCRYCGEFLDGRKPNAPSSETANNRRVLDMPVCQQCRAPMRKEVISSGNCLGIVLALIVFSIGVAVTIGLPVFGWFIGPLICIGALFMGGKRTKVWKCIRCGSIVDRN